MIRDLGLDQPPVDPTTLTGDELVKEVQRVVKALLGYGARLPKELMLFVKNMVFLDGAIARLAPDLDLLAEIANISMYFAQTPRRAARRGARHRPDTRCEFDLDGVKAGFGLDPRRRPPHLPRAPAAPRADPEAHARARRAAAARRLDAIASPAVRLVIARCSVDYDGRLTAHLPEATRLIMVKADGCVAIHADGGAYKPLNWMNAPNTLVEQRRPRGS